MKKKFLSIIYAAVMATCGVFATGCGKENKTTNKTPTSEEIIIDGKEEEAIPMPKAMSFSAPKLLSDSGEPVAQTSSVTLTATVEPSNATYQAVDWSVSFVNQSSTWASGKTASDYVTVTPTSDGALTATVECLAAFGEPINVTVTSRDNADASATCVCDYLKPVEDINITLKQAGNVVEKVSFTENGIDTVFSATPVYGVGTKSRESIEMELSWNILGIQMYANSYDVDGMVLKNFDKSWKISNAGPISFSASKSQLISFLVANDGMKPVLVQPYLNFYISAIEKEKDIFTLSVEYTRDGERLNYKSVAYKGIAPEFSVSVTGLSLNNTTLEF